jgi:hypothetical protein
VAFVLAPLLVFCACGTVVGGPALWVIRQTLEASRGAPSPDAAADTYLMALSYDNEDGLVAVLDNDHQDELLKQWHAYRDAMKGTDPPPFRLDFGSLTVGPIERGRAEVTTDVSAVWSNTDENGRLGGYRSKDHTWHFKTREDHGWQVAGVAAPAWCGDYVLPEKCR